eukprot:3538121-Amphidinium_carterae.1
MVHHQTYEFHKTLNNCEMQNATTEEPQIVKCISFSSKTHLQLCNRIENDCKLKAFLLTT